MPLEEHRSYTARLKALLDERVEFQTPCDKRDRCLRMLLAQHLGSLLLSP